MTGRVMLGVCLTLSLSLALLGQNAQEIYQRGLVQEQAEGNLKQAIELSDTKYCSVAATPRPTAEITVTYEIQEETPAQSSAAK